MRKPRMALPVIGSPLHDWSMMTATSAATTTAPAIVRVRSRPNTCRISVTFNQLLRGCLYRPVGHKNAPLTGWRQYVRWKCVDIRALADKTDRSEQKLRVRGFGLAMPSVQSSGASAGSPGAGGVLIVGGGQAAVHLASSLRELGWQAAGTIVSGEPRAPYQRPPLSKAFLSGNSDPATLEFRSAERYERDRITVLTGQRVTGLQAAAAGGARVRPGRGLLPARRGSRARAAGAAGGGGAGACRRRRVHRA